MIRVLRRRYPLLSLCVAVGFLAALGTLAHRLGIEQSSRTVEITIDGDDWATLARRSGRDRDALYADLYHRGVRSVTLYAASLRRLAETGLVTFLPGADLLNAARTGPLVGPLGDLVRSGRIHPNATYVLGSPSILRLVQAGFAAQIGEARTTLLQGSGPVLEIGGRGRELEDASLGVLPEEVASARARHLTTELRVRNFHEITPDRLDAFFADLERVQVPFTLIFDRDQVLGYDQLIPDVAEEMKRAGFVFGWIESLTARRRQKGDDVLVRLVKPAVVRVFSLTPEELAGITPQEARDKYVLAARERNDRILYVRPFLTTPVLGAPPGVDVVQANLDYVGSIADGLTSVGYTLGKARPLNATDPRARLLGVLFALAALGALAGTAITMAEVSEAFGRPTSPRTLLWGVGAGVVLTGMAIAVHHAALWRQILALLAALSFPTLSMMWIVPGARRGATEGSTPSGARVLARSIAGLWVVSAATAIGGVMVAALLSDWAFMMEVRGFLGVKPAHIIPVLVIGLLLAAVQEPPGRLWPRLRAWLRQPLLLEYGIAIIAVAVLVVFALGRTGNLGLPALSGLELKSRALLQHLLLARPRTKEYLVGHPFMVLTFALAALGARRWVLPAAMIGAIGQVGLVNSFSHIHTPLVYVVLRTLYALVLGSLLGAVLVGVLLWSRRFWPSGSPASGSVPGLPPGA